MYKWILCIVFLSLSVALVSNAQDICPKEKSDAINEYMNVYSIDDLVDQILVEIMKKVPEEDREVFSNKWISAFDKNELKEGLLSAMCKNFSIAEIKALTQFYGSPEGKSVMEKMPQYVAEYRPYINAVTQRAIQKAMEELAKNGKKRQLNK
jgi:hypothetical protein